jgi:four helix bundle protein
MIAQPDELQVRLIDFAVAVIKLCAALPHTQPGQYVAQQMLKCGTAPAPHYVQVHHCDSAEEYIDRLKQILKDLNETLVWLEIINKSGMLPENSVIYISDECGRLREIISSTLQT